MVVNKPNRSWLDVLFLLLLSCCLYARGDLRERRGLVVIVLIAHVISVAAMAILLERMEAVAYG